MYLAAAGVGTIGMVDDDVVDGATSSGNCFTGLVMLEEASWIQLLKAFRCKPERKLEPHHKRLSSSNALSRFSADIM